jgi:hypothetical protein
MNIRYFPVNDLQIKKKKYVPGELSFSARTINPIKKLIKITKL